MKLLFLAKRRPQQRDLLTRPFGRFYYLPRHLAEKGHDVTVILLSYKNDGTKTEYKDNITWISISIFPGLFFGYYAFVKNYARQYQPDWIIGFSDTWYGIIAQRIARHLHAKSLIDAYDNYESYMPWCKPLHWLWRNSLKRADMVTAAGPQLLGLLNRARESSTASHVIPMSADPVFQPDDKNQARKQLALPVDSKLLGYCGSISETRGIADLFKAFSLVRQTLPDIRLVLSGRLDKGVLLPEGVIYMGYLKDASVPVLINAMDCMVTLVKPGAFGDFSYPIKLYETIACKKPVVATDISPCRWILQNHEEFLANSPTELADKVMQILEKDMQMDIHYQGWQESADKFEQIMATEKS